ncbi:MAG: DUF3300 domain-containing protein [Phycisphaerae bacterium]|nr:DUF3300 domain-containing protein [Phycisphaerae bacterium]
MMRTRCQDNYRSKRHRQILGILCCVALAAGSKASAEQLEQSQPEEGVAGAPVDKQIEKLSPAELDDLVGPIALYPDDLLGNVLAASAYPIEIVQAARLLDKNGGKIDEDAIKKLDFDPGVLALMHYPDVIKKMNDDLDWTSALGDAVVAQQEDVMAAIQRFRAKASDAGNLLTDDKITVAKEKEIITVVQTDPQVIYVPTYNPEVVVVRQEVSAAPIITFGTGWAVGGWVAYGCHWGHYHNGYKVKINHNSYWGGVRPGWGGGSYWRPPPAHRPGYGPGYRPGYRPGGGRPGYGPPSGGRPGAGKPIAGRPSQLPSAVRPSAGDRPGGRRPAGGDRPGAGRPSAGRPSQLPSGLRPGAGTGRPSQLPSAGRPAAGTGRPSQLPSAGRPAAGAARTSQLPSGQRPSPRPTARPTQRTSQSAFGGYGSGQSARRSSQRGAESRSMGSSGARRSAPSRGGAGQRGGGGRRR